MAQETLNPFVISTGQRKLKQLFWEQVGADKSSVVYTLKDREHEGYPSLYQLYMTCDDPTEYTFATTYLDSWEHWEMLCQCTWFKPFVARWRRELELRTKAKALAQIKALAADPTSKDFHQANKFLVNSGWKDLDGKAKRGRPSKEEIAKTARLMADEARSLEDDLQRVQGLN